MKTIAYIFIILSLLACAVKVPMQKAYFANETKTGFAILTNPIKHFGGTHSRGFGLVGVLIVTALKPEDPYHDAFKVLEPQINPNERFKNLYNEIFESKGKKLIPINNIAFDSLVKFKKPSKTHKKYFEYDLRFLKERYQIDELLFSNVNYGVLSFYKYGIEFSKSGQVLVYTIIVDLNDNSLRYADETQYLNPINGSWDKPPLYTNLKFGIKTAIENAVHLIKVKFK